MSKLGKQGPGTGEDNGFDAGPAAALHVFWLVVNVKDLARGQAKLTDRSAVNDRIRLGGSRSAGIDPGREEAHEAEVGLQMGHVNGVGIGEQSQATTGGELSEKVVTKDGFGGERAVPYGAELAEGKREAEAARQVLVPIARGDATLLPIAPAGVGLDGLPDLFGAGTRADREAAKGALDVHAHDHAPDVKEQASGRGGGGQSHG